MKKLLTLLLTLVMAFCLVSINNKKTKAESVNLTDTIIFKDGKFYKNNPMSTALSDQELTDLGISYNNYTITFSKDLINNNTLGNVNIFVALRSSDNLHEDLTINVTNDITLHSEYGSALTYATCGKLLIDGNSSNKLTISSTNGVALNITNAALFEVKNTNVICSSDNETGINSSGNIRVKGTGKIVAKSASNGYPLKIGFIVDGLVKGSTSLNPTSLSKTNVEIEPENRLKVYKVKSGLAKTLEITENPVQTGLDLWYKLDGTTLHISNGDPGTGGYIHDDKYNGLYSKDLQGFIPLQSSVQSVVFDNEVKPISTAFWFYSLRNLDSIDFTNLNTSNTICMRQMFDATGFVNLTFPKSFDTSKVIDMNGMFSDSDKLATIDITNFKTDSLINTEEMFSGCIKLTSIDISKFNTKKLINISGMFRNCRALKSLDLSNFDTSNVINMQNAFGNCDVLESLNVTSFDTSKVANMINMFGCCKSLKELDLTSFDTSKVKGMALMFDGCQDLETIKVSKDFNLSSLETGADYNMFNGCTSLVGANGTSYNQMLVDDPTNAMLSKYACIDTKNKQGYFTKGETPTPKPTPDPGKKDESCEKVIGPTWHWNNTKGVCEEVGVVGTSTR